jgi:hypothetical protein
MTKYLYAGTLLLIATSAAYAASEFYVALDTSAKQCRVMSMPPDGTVMKSVADQPYASMAEAEEAMARLPECKS